MIWLDIALIVIGAAATWYLGRASTAIVQLHREQRAQHVALAKQTKQLLRNIARTQATADRILNRTYRFQSQVEVLLMDPKIQKALNRHDRGVS